MAKRKAEGEGTGAPKRAAPAAPAAGAHKPWRKSKQAHASELGLGMSGVLITCGTHAEPRAVREGFDLLNAAWDAVAEAQPAAAEDEGADASAPADGGTVVDLAAQIAREAASLKQGKRFFVAQADCPGFVVLRANPAVQPQPPMLQLANAICAAVAQRGAAVGPREPVRPWLPALVEDVAARVYELDPVVPGRVVRGRHADPGDGAALGEGARGHQDAAADDEFEEFLFF